MDPYWLLLDKLLPQLILVETFVAGFSLTIFVQLIASKEKSKLMQTVLALLLISAIILLLSTITHSTELFIVNLILVDPALDGEVGLSLSLPPPMQVLPFFTGILLFLIGIGLIGWIHSKPIGLISTTVMIGAILVLAVYLSRVLN